MLVLALFLAVCAGARARPFNITHLHVPAVVPPGQYAADIECRYDANFTILSWFKGRNEFFRYRPGSAPSTRSFPVLGVGTVEMIACGPAACHLRLGALTEEATGLYRCDIERDVPPYKFETKTAHMEVHWHEHRRPLLEGLAEEYGEGDIIQAYCRGAKNTELRWYINGHEILDVRGSTALKRNSTRLLFIGLPPKLSVQCAEFRYGKLYGSEEQKSRWTELGQMRKRKSGSNVILGRLNLLSLSIFICLLDINFYV